MTSQQTQFKLTPFLKCDIHNY